MAKRNDSLSAKRAEAMARHAAANRKVARLRRKGVDISGTKYDVRRDPAKIKNYNRVQLDAYINRVNTFVDRKTQYVGDVHGRPIAPAVAREYRQTENKLNRIINDAYDRVKNVKLPGQNRTVDDRMKAITPEHKHAGNAANSPYKPIVRQGKNFANEKKMRELTAKMKKKLKTDFLAKDLKTDLATVKDMAAVLGRDDLYQRAKSLTNDQFNVLFNFWGFIDKLALAYEFAHLPSRGEKKQKNGKEWFQTHLDRNLREAEKLLGHAEKIQLGS